jgi:hypothetical protein
VLQVTVRLSLAWPPARQVLVFEGCGLSSWLQLIY